MQWYKSAHCEGMELESFFEEYVDDPAPYEHRKFIDAICMGCPVVKQCYRTGVDHEGWGVWGGFYMEGGYIPRQYNEHKTDEDFDTLLLRITSD